MMDLFEKEMKVSKEMIENLPWEHEEFYANYLAQTYYFVCHSTRLLGKGASYFDVTKEDHYQRFYAHMKEEHRHEKLASSDLKNLGKSLKDYPELPITKAFYERQYYRIDKTQAMDFYGYILYLEGIAIYAYPDVYERLKKCYGEKSCHFLRVHVQEDPDHVKKAFESLDMTSEQDRQLIAKNFEDTASLYKIILKECL